jgi:hypothetical protein
MWHSNFAKHTSPYFFFIPVSIFYFFQFLSIFFSSINYLFLFFSTVALITMASSGQARRGHLRPGPDAATFGQAGHGKGRGKLGAGRRMRALGSTEQIGSG